MAMSTFTTFGVAFCLISHAAFADVKVCNEYRDPVWVAIGWIENHDTRTRGWYEVKTGACAVVDDRALQKPHYIYAETNWRDVSGGGRTMESWGGKGQLVVGAGDSFNYVHAQTVSRNDRTVGFKDLAATVDGTINHVVYRLHPDGINTTTEYKP